MPKGKKLSAFGPDDYLLIEVRDYDGELLDEFNGYRDDEYTKQRIKELKDYYPRCEARASVDQ